MAHLAAHLWTFLMESPQLMVKGYCTGLAYSRALTGALPFCRLPLLFCDHKCMDCTWQNPGCCSPSWQHWWCKGPIPHNWGFGDHDWGIWHCWCFDTGGHMRCRSWLVSSCAKSLAWSNTNEGGRISSGFPPRWQVHEDLDLTGTGLVHWTCFSSWFCHQQRDTHCCCCLHPHPSVNNNCFFKMMKCTPFLALNCKTGMIPCPSIVKNGAP